MSSRQNVLSFVNRNGKFVKVAGKGLIKTHNLSERFRRMNLGSGAPSRKHGDEMDMGGTVKNHNRPYQLNDMASKNKSSKSYTPIHFKL